MKPINFNKNPFSHYLYSGWRCLLFIFLFFQIGLFGLQDKIAEYQRMYNEAGELQQKAQESFDAGKYAEGQDYAEKAAELAEQATAGQLILLAEKAAALLDEANQGIDFLIYNKIAAKDSTEITSLQQQAQESKDALDQRNFTQSISISEDIQKKTVVLKKKQKAEYLYAEIKKKILEAKNMNLDQDNKETFAQIASLIPQIEEAMKSSKWDQSIALSENIIEWLAKLNVPSLLPAAYTVRFIPHRRDCLWRIAEYAFIYNDGKHWPHIYEANKPKFRDRTVDLIFPGEVFKIPSIADEERSGKYGEE